jgi:hypothetical protein
VHTAEVDRPALGQQRVHDGILRETSGLMDCRCTERLSLISSLPSVVSLEVLLQDTAQLLATGDPGHPEQLAATARDRQRGGRRAHP